MKVSGSRSLPVSLAVSLVLAGGAAAGVGPEVGAATLTSRAQAPSSTVAAAPVYQVTVHTESYVDTTRGTAANGTTPAQPSRALPTTIYQPQGVAGQRFGLFVFSHGLTGEPQSYDALLRSLASRGFVVAAPRFPLTNKRTVGKANPLDEINQPADVRFVIDQLLKKGSDTLAVIDASKIAIGGHSLGAITAIDMMTNTCCYDARVKAVIAVAGTTNFFRPGKQFSAPATPILFIHGDKDPTVPYALGYSAYQAAKPSKFFLTVIGGGHSFDLRGVPDSQVRVATAIGDAMVAFLQAQLSGPSVGDTRSAAAASLTAVAAANPALFRYEAVLR